MGAPRRTRKRASTGALVMAFGLAMASAAGIAALFSWGQHQLDERSLRESRALMVGRSVAEVARRGELKNRAELQVFADALLREVSGLQQIFVLRGPQYLAHTDPALAGARLQPSSLGDKALFDQSRRLQKAHDDNLKARRDDPALDVNVTNVQEVDSLGSPVTAAVPVIQQDRVQAMVHVAMEPLELPGQVPWLALLLLVAAASAALALVALYAPASANFVAIGLAALTVIGSFLLIQQRQRGQYLEAVTQRGKLVVSLAHALEAAGQALLAPALPPELVADAPPLPPGVAVPAATGWEMSPELLGRINVSQREVPYGDLVRVATAEGASPTLAEQYAAGTTELAVRDRGREVAVSRTALQAVFDRHGRTLRVLGLLVLSLALGAYLFVALGYFGHVAGVVKDHSFAYAYTLPAMIGMAILVFVPFGWGVVLGFMRRVYNVWSFVGFDNFLQILGNFDFVPRSFYYTLSVTLLWTVVNVALHVSIGLALALILHDKMLRMKAVYRVLLVLPWAMPSYITALIWKGMFHQQFGAVNHYIGFLGVEPVSWFQSFWTAFAANVATNTWLGFPFMMVISLGALQSIPGDLYEAADVDGASKWQQFRSITLPLLKPALFPAIILGTIWTFNQFNIIYLVSGGQPVGSTDILIVEAYRWAFENDAYGYAAAYSTIIFVILLSYTLITNRWARATAGAYE
jgi:ABC-type sugar transport system permease subunit